MESNNNKNRTNSRRKRHYNKYSYALKRKVVNDIMKGILTKEEAMLKYGIRSRQSINDWLNKYSLLNYRNQKNYGMKQSPEEKIKELKARIEELETDKIILNTVIDIADEIFNSNIRKKHLPQQLKDYKKHLQKKSKDGK